MSSGRSSGQHNAKFVGIGPALRANVFYAFLSNCVSVFCLFHFVLGCRVKEGAPSKLEVRHVLLRLSSAIKALSLKLDETEIMSIMLRSR